MVLVVALIAALVVFGYFLLSGRQRDEVWEHRRELLGLKVIHP